MGCLALAASRSAMSFLLVGRMAITVNAIRLPVNAADPRINFLRCGQLLPRRLAKCAPIVLRVGGERERGERDRSDERECGDDEAGFERALPQREALRDGQVDVQSGRA